MSLLVVLISTILLLLREQEESESGFHTSKQCIVHCSYIHRDTLSNTEQSSRFGFHVRVKKVKSTVLVVFVDLGAFKHFTEQSVRQAPQGLGDSELLPPLYVSSPSLLCNIYHV